MFRNNQYRVNILAIQIIGLIFFTLPLVSFSKSDYKLNEIPDHAPLHSSHDQKAEVFIQKNLKEKGKFSLSKIELFLNRLKQEKIAFEKDVYEEKLFEKVTEELKSLKKAKKSAKKAIKKEKKSKVSLFSKYLIPRVELLKKRLLEGAPQSELEAIVDSFIAGYSAVYFPHKKKALPWYLNSDLQMAINGVRVYRFKKGLPPEKEIEANNLTFGKNLKKSIQKCFSLNELPKKGYPLTQNEIVKIKKCGIDVSKLNPVKSIFWKKIKSKNYKEVKNLKNKRFPGFEDKIFFDKVRYGSYASPKFNAYFIKKNDNGYEEKKKFKFKLGVEVNSEPASTMLAKLTGFHQDDVLHRPEVKVYFKGSSYNEFVKLFSVKYHGLGRNLSNFVTERGTENGVEWAKFRNVLFEAKNPKKIKMYGWHPRNMDFDNRREFRGAILFYAWINSQDMRSSNHTFYLVKKKGQYLPEGSLQDIGKSLRPALVFRPKYLINIGKYLQWWHTVNGFSESILKFNNKKVTVYWNDFYQEGRRFKTSTFNDLKWMARKIAKIPHEDIKYALKVSGWHKDIQDLYVHKLTNRRNEMVRAFDLEDEFSIYPVPNLNTYSPNENIKNGKLTKRFLKGSTAYEGRPANIISALTNSVPSFMKLLSNYINIPEMVNKIGQKINTKIQLGKKYEGDGFPIFNTTKIVPGLKLFFSREVAQNPELVGGTNDDQVTAFYTKDKITVEISLGSWIGPKIFQKIPSHLSTNLTVWKRDFEMIQFANSFSKAYRVPFKLPFALMDLENFVPDSLNSQEIIKIADSWGFRIGGGVSIPTGTPGIRGLNLNPKINGSYKYARTRPIYYYRDSFKQLHVFKEEVRTHGMDLGVSFGNIDLFLNSYGLLGVRSSAHKIKTEAELYSFNIKNKKIGTSTISLFQRAKEKLALLHLMSKEGNPVFPLLRKSLNLNVKEVSKKFGLNILSFFRVNKKRGLSHSSVTLNDGSTRNFLKYMLNSSSGRGISLGPWVSRVFRLRTENLKSKNRTTIIEMDEERPMNGVGIITLNEFDRSITRVKLEKFIQNLNIKYSESKNVPFFRDYILPPKNEVPRYSGVGSQVQLYINIKGAILSLKNLNKKEIRNVLREFFLKRKGIKGKRKKLVSYSLLKMRVLKAKRQIKKYENKPKKLIKSLGKLFHKINAMKNGFSLFQKLFGKKNLFVMGFISGVHNSYGTSKNRNFFGKSYGTYKEISPLTKFLKENQLGPANFLIRNSDFSF